MASSNTEPPPAPTGDAILDIIAQGITRHYARQLLAARDSGDQAAIVRVMNAIHANHPCPEMVGRVAVLLSLQQP